MGKIFSKKNPTGSKGKELVHKRLKVLIKYTIENSPQILFRICTENWLYQNEYFEKKVNDGPASWKSCSTVVHSPQFYQKHDALVRPNCRSAENSNICTGKPPWQRLFFTKVSGVDFIPAISLQKDFIKEGFLHGFCTISFFILSGNFLRDTFTKHFLTKS